MSALAPFPASPSACLAGPASTCIPGPASTCLPGPAHQREREPTQVFFDPTGRRARWVRAAARVVGAASLIWLVTVAPAVVGSDGVPSPAGPAQEVAATASAPNETAATFAGPLMPPAGPIPQWPASASG
jgi:hypothetical protein